MENQIDNQVKQTYRYFYDDGLVEMAVGLLFVATGLVLLAWQGINDSSILTIVVAIGLPVVVTGGAYLIKRLVSEMKQRITYPRTGYVAYREGEPSKGRWLIPLTALAMVVASLFLPEVLMGMSAMVGALLGAVLIVIGYRVGLWRLYIIGAIAAVTGVALSWANVNETLAVAFTFAIAGAAHLLAGTLAFAGYLYRHPEPHDELP